MYEGRATFINGAVIVPINFAGLIRGQLQEVDLFESIGLKDEWTMRRNLANWMQTATRFEDSGVLFIKCAERELFEGCEVQASLDFFGYAQALCELDKDEDAIKQFRLGREYFKKQKIV